MEQKLTELKGKINIPIIGISICLSIIDSMARQKYHHRHIRLETFHPTTAEYIFFSSTQGTFFRKDYKLGHKIVSINLK